MSHQDKSLSRLTFHNGERCQGVLSQLATGDGEKLFFCLLVMKKMRLAVLYRARFTVNLDGPVSWLRWRHPALLKEAPVRGCSPPAVLLGWQWSLVGATELLASTAQWGTKQQRHRMRWVPTPHLLTFLWQYWRLQTSCLQQVSAVRNSFLCLGEERAVLSGTVPLWCPEGGAGCVVPAALCDARCFVIDPSPVVKAFSKTE